MKKRTLVCFLIFLLCVFHSSIPDTVLGQDADPTPEELAQQVYDKYSATLTDDTVIQGDVTVRGMIIQVLTLLSDPAVLENPIVVGFPGGFNGALDFILGNPGFIGTAVPNLSDADEANYISLLSMEAIQTMLKDSTVRTLIQNSDAVVLLLDKIKPSDDGTTPPDDGTTPPDDGTTPPDDGTTPPDDGTTPPDDGTTPPDDGTTPPDDGTTPPDDGTTPPDDGTTPPTNPTPPTKEELPTVDLTTSNLNGQSRVGGFSLNRIHGRAFIRKLIATALTDSGLSANISDSLVEPVVDFILAQVPQGFLPKKQIKQMLTATQPSSIFTEEEGSQLDFENFGNAIVPDLAEIIYTDVDNVTKYLANDNLNVYVRVPSTLLGGNVQVGINGYKEADATRITPLIFQQDTIPYTFRLEETLAATNLPAWPDANFDSQIFSGVVLRYSQTGIDGEYFSEDMDPVQTEKGVVWESEIGIQPPKAAGSPASNIYYYFEVTLAEPVTLEIINPEALGAAINSVDGTHALEATKTHTINSWAMPDPRNIQLDDRGIFNAVFTPAVSAKIVEIATPIISSAIAGGTLDFKVPGKQIRQLQHLLLNNAYDLFTHFETTFDPMLVSVFSLPYVDITKESLWYANIDSVADGDVSFEARVINVDGEVVDHIVADIKVDDSAPETDINIEAAEHATGYWNRDGVFVSTANPADTPALVNITSTVTKGTVGNGQGYLIYQIIKLDEHGRPLGTWLPLTVQNSMIASDLWELVVENLPDNLKEFPIPGTNTILNINQFPLDFIISALQGDVPIPGADIDTIIIDAIENTVGIRITDAQYALLTDLLGAVIDDISLLPVTSDPSQVMTIPIQGQNLPLMLGDYGIRAMGIDTLFNVGSHVAPTRLRVVVPEWDRTSVAMASLGDLNGDGDADESYESGTIYSNATDVTLTIMVDERTVHPGTIVVQYTDANGAWQTIGELDLAEADVPAGTALTLPWSVTDFDDLVAAGNTVQLRTVTTNGLQLTDESEAFSINLDADVHPVDPKVLTLDVDASSIVMTNPDSEAPQGTIQLIGYTPRRTVPETTSILVEAKRASDTEWATVDTVEMGDPNGIAGEDTAAITFKDKTLGEIYPSDTSMIHIDATSSYLMWTVTVDTTLLEDSITVNNPGARDVSLDNNRYMVRATPVVDGSLPNNPNENPIAEGENYTEMFSVDNDDDVAPLGPTNVVATSIEATDAIFTDNGDGTYTVGGLVDKYDPEVNSPTVTFIITPTAVRKTYHSVKLLTTLPEGAIISEITETQEGGGVFTVTIDVGTLMDADGLVHTNRYLEDVYVGNPNEFIHNPKGEVFTFQLHALAYDKATPYDDVTNADAMFLEYGNIQADNYDDDEITVSVQNSYRYDPGVIAITVENSDGMVNPDSGAPQGELTFSVYTYYITSPPTEGIRVEVKRPVDETWERITGTAVEPVEVDVSDVPGVADLDDITGGLVGITEAGTESAGESVVAIPGRYMKWQFIVDTRELALEDTVTAEDTIKLDDTISRGDASERDVSVDDNQYEVRAISLTPKNLNQPEYPQRDGVEASFSLDNLDDVPPLGPTNITGISDRDAYGDMQPIDANEDGSYTVGGIVDPGVNSPAAIFSVEPTAEPITYANGSLKLVQTAPDGSVTEADGSLDDGYIEIDVGLLENGTYMYYALVADEFGNVQVQGEADMPSPIVTVHVNNFRVSDVADLTVTSVDSVMVDGELPERIPLRESIGVSFNVPNGTLMVNDLTAIHVNGEQAVFTAGSDAENAFSLMASELSNIASGHYTVRAEVTKRNGSVTFPLAMINLDNTAPMISFTSPVEGEAINDLPTLHAAFNDGELGVGISDAETVVVSLARIRPDSDGQEEIAISVDQSMVEQDIDSVVYTRIDKLAGGAYKFTVQVSDSLNNVGEASIAFAVEGVNPTVMITAPASGQEFDATPESVTGFFAGGGEVSISKFTVNDVDVSESVTVDGNNFTYMPAEGFSEDAHTVAVEVTDGSGLTAQTSLTFTIEIPGPSIAIHAPASGQMYDHGMPAITVESSGVAEPITESVMVNGEAATMNDDGTYSPATALGDGEHTVVATATDASGKTAEATVIFSVEIPGPSIAIHSPASGQMYDHGMPAITVESSGVAEPVAVSVMVNGEAATMNSDGTYSPATALGDGDHTVVATATDASGKTAEATVIFSVEIPGPSIAIHSPASGQMYDHGMPAITVESSGVAEPVAVSVMVNGEAATMNDDGTYSPATALGDGDHTVVATATDANGKTAEATVIFSVEIPGPSVAIHSPAAGQMYSHDMPAITWESSGVAEPISTSLTINGEEVELADGAVSYTPSEGLGEGEHTVVVTVTDANGKSAQATAVFTVEFPVASVTLLSPTAGHTYTNGTPVISGEFTGVGEVTVKLTVDGKDTKVTVEGNQFTGELADALGHGMHTVAVEITDANGESAMTSAEFMVDLPAPTVAILSPAPAQTYGNGEAIVIRVEFTGMDASVSSFTINGEDVAVEPEDNMFMHTPEGLTTGEYVVAVEVTDAANNKKAQDTVVFNVKLDSTPPAISEVAPSGTLKDTWVNISVVVSDEQSNITGVDFYIRNEGDTHKGFLPLGTVISGAASSATAQQIADGNILTQGSFAPGTHTLQVVATSEGGSSSHTWSFTVVTDNIKPTITSITPSGTIHAGLPTISASAHDESGVADIVITVMDSNGEAVEGDMQNDDEDGSVGITRADFMPEMPLDEGTYAIEVRATDTYGNTSSAKGGFTVDFDTAAPLITSSSPQDGARLMYAHDEEKIPTISITYGDAETGVNVDSIRFVFNNKLINLTDDQKSATQVIYMPPADLEPGQYTVKIEVSDNAQIQGNVSDEAEGAREANTAVYQFSFFVEHGEVPILKAAPFNYPNPFEKNTRISFVLARRSNVSITIYDVTLRPVRVLVDNEVMEAGYYTRAADGSGSNAIGWNGKSSNGEDLARGIYFCQIMVTDGIEPEYAILKLALTR